MRLLLLVLLGLASIGAPRADEPPAVSGLKRARLYIAGSESLFTTVNRADAIASLKVWIENLAKNRGFQFETRMEITQSTGELLQRLKENALDLLVLDTPDYLPLADAKLIEAVASGTRQGQVGAFPYLLLTNDSSGARQLAGLRGKRITVASRTKSNMGLIWTETLLAEDHLGRAHTFFSSVDINYRALSCVLPLFFGRIDACVVDFENWELMKELNPQLGRLRVLARSQPLLEGVIAMPVQPHPYRRELIDSILELHKQRGGEQLATVFKTGPLVRVGPEHFESVRELCNRYRRLVDPSGDLPRKTASALAAPTTVGLGLAGSQLAEGARKEHP